MSIQRPIIDARLPNALPVPARARHSALSGLYVLAVLIGILLASCHEASSYYIYTGPSGGGGSANKAGGSGQAGALEAGADNGGVGGDAIGAGG